MSRLLLLGALSAETSDDNSDIDVYIFTKTDILIETRENIIKPISSKFEIGGEYFGSGDEFIFDNLGKQLDLMYWTIEWIESVVNKT